MNLIGRMVNHPRYGIGKVLKTKDGGSRLLVRFDESVKNYYVRIDEVEFEDRALHTEQSSQGLTKIDEKKFKSRQLIEALRLGIIPTEAVKDFTFGRDQELRQLQDWLENGMQKDCFRLLIGSYGVGKTHLINYVSSCYALDLGYATSKVEINPLESPFSRPKQIYKEIVRNLRTRDGDDFKEFLKRNFMQDKILFANHPYFRHVREYQSYEFIWDWIMARESAPRPNPTCDRETARAIKNLPGLYDDGRSANIYCYILSTLGWLVTRSQGKGILLIFDEVESIHSSMQTQISKTNGFNFLDALSYTAQGRKAMLDNPQDSGLIFSRYASKIPFLFDKVSGLKILLTLTDNRTNKDDKTEIYNSKIIYLNPVSAQVFEEISDKVFDEYKCAYDFLVNDVHKQHKFKELYREKLREHQEYESTRHVVKLCVEILDLIRHNCFSN